MASTPAVLQIAVSTGGYSLLTERGKVDADTVILATNG